MDNRIVHIEIAGRDGEALETFYRGLFDWPIEREHIGGFPYGRIQWPADERPAFTGGLRHEPTGSAEIVVYVQVADLHASLSKAKALGGSVRLDPIETPASTFALIEDPEGNPIGLIQPTSSPTL